MDLHRFEPDRFSNVLGGMDPVLRIASGDRVATKTVDAHGVNERMEKVAERPNPVTGPFLVEGAGPGDTLAVTLEEIVPNRDRGWSSDRIAPGAVDPEYVPRLNEKSHRDWIIDAEGGRVVFQGGSPRRSPLSVPLAPMLGTIGVAPAGGQRISTMTSGPWGGNMDCRSIRAGSTIHLPVFVEGALFALGDGHAAQGDGELAGSGVEVSMDVLFTVRLVKDAAIEWPRGEDRDSLFTIGNARPLEDAVRHAVTGMMRWLWSDYGLDSVEGAMLLGQGAELDISNMFDPAYTAVCRVGKDLVDGRMHSGT
jgi:amidase